MAERDPANTPDLPPPASGGWRHRAELAIVLALAALIIAGGALLWHRYSANAPLEITLIDQQVTVYVGGAVENPGLYTFRPDAHIADALQAAGGVTSAADMSAIDLTGRLQYGEDLYVPTSGAASQRISVNSADVWLLDALPGIGEITAQKIVDYRTQHGPFHSLEDLRDLKLVTASTFDKIKDLITLGP